ncbi:MAG TPA: family 10 glycosylhydrolase [Longimicrobiaceae bacterium]|nr:family 10 glycosylhydrolase [Longimicrobiaceae bacterium]
MPRCRTRVSLRRFLSPVPLVLGLAVAVLASACSRNPRALAGPDPSDDGPPPIAREFRGVWVASVANIDWPSRPGLPVAQQQAELLAMLDRAKALGLNAVILQVRPAADALYRSELEPWSEYLTGEQGRAPEPLYDPLELAVTEAHRRGLELHAWFNPYRARHPSATGPEAASHIARARPELVKRYGGFLWMDPGEPEVQERTVQVMLDVVRRYDVDGIHIDDYFYPYPVRDSAGAIVPFPDEPSWRRYVEAGGRLERDDWRRQNVDELVERLYREIKREKPWVKFGISPFGIWRPGHPEQIRTGFDQYGQIYADARRWWLEGWMDYFAPQLYWPIAQTPQSYPVLLRWWAERNARGRHLWPGNFTSRVAYGDRPFWPAEEILGQVYVTRGHPGATGNVHFSMRVLMQDPDSLATLLATQAYREPALVPASPWLYAGAPGRPGVEARRGAGGVELTLEPAGSVGPTWWAVRSRFGTGWRREVLPGWMRTHAVSADSTGAVAEEVVVSAVDRVGNEGPAARLRVRER